MCLGFRVRFRVSLRTSRLEPVFAADFNEQ